MNYCNTNLKGYCNKCIKLYNVRMDMKEFIQIDEASKILNVTTMTLRRWDKAGKLKAYRHPINKYRLYKKSDIEELLRGITND